jgi:hypothetical protein
MSAGISVAPGLTLPSRFACDTQPKRLATRWFGRALLVLLTVVGVVWVGAQRAEAAPSFVPGPNIESESNLSAVTSADLNGDGKRDLVLTSTTASTVSVKLGNGAGGFGAETDFATGSNPAAVTFADFNGDGKRDLAVANTPQTAYPCCLATARAALAPRPTSRRAPAPTRRSVLTSTAMARPTSR